MQAKLSHISASQKFEINESNFRILVRMQESCLVDQDTREAKSYKQIGSIVVSEFDECCNCNRFFKA